MHVHYRRVARLLRKVKCYNIHTCQSKSRQLSHPTPVSRNHSIICTEPLLTQIVDKHDIWCSVYYQYNFMTNILFDRIVLIASLIGSFVKEKRNGYWPCGRCINNYPPLRLFLCFIGHRKIPFNLYLMFRFEIIVDYIAEL